MTPVEPYEVKGYYYGCYQEPGHFLWEALLSAPDNPQRCSYYGLEWMKRSDGLFPPQPERDSYLYLVNHCFLHGYTILSWWDRSVDKRPGSSSTIFLPKVFTMDATGFFAAKNYAEQLFPWVFQRLPVKLMRVPAL